MRLNYLSFDYLLLLRRKMLHLYHYSLPLLRRKMLRLYHYSLPLLSRNILRLYHYYLLLLRRKMLRLYVTINIDFTHFSLLYVVLFVNRSTLKFLI